MSQLCNEARFISQLSLDGIVVNRTARQRAVEHREQCTHCMNFHQTLIQATALASDISTDEVFNHSDMSSVSKKLKELLDELGGNNEPTDTLTPALSYDSSIEARLEHLLGPPEAMQPPEPERVPEPGRLISRMERDGRIIETFLDQKGWTTTRIQSIGTELPAYAPSNYRSAEGSDEAFDCRVDNDDIVKPPVKDAAETADSDAPQEYKQPGSIPSKVPFTGSSQTGAPTTPPLRSTPPQPPATPLRSLAPQPGQASFSASHDRQKKTLFDLTANDVDEIFGRMYTSRSRERRKESDDELREYDNARLQLSDTQPELPVPSDLPPLGFSISRDALAHSGRISTDKLEGIVDAQGCIRDIGRFLLDPDAVNAFERIIKSREVNVLVNRLTVEQNAILEKLQNYMHQQHEVIATLVVGRDNQVLNGRYRTDAVSEEIAQWALCAYINSKTSAELLNSKDLYHIILSNNQGDVIISDLGQTFLITVTNKQDSQDREALMRKLEILLG